MGGTWRWVAAAAAAPVAWGTTYPVIGHALPQGDPVWGGVLRALPAGLVLLALPLHPDGRRLRGAWWWRAAALGLLLNAAFFSLVYAAAQLLPSSVAATVTGIAPLLVLALAWPVLGERPRLAATTAALVGLAGVALLVGASSDGLDPRGVVASATGVLAFCTGTVLAQRWSRQARAAGRPAPRPVTLTAWQLLLSSLLVLPLAVVTEGAPPAYDATAVLAMGYVSLVATAAAFSAFSASLTRLAAPVVALVGLLNPVTGVALGTVAAGELLTAAQWVGLLLVLAGIALGQVRRRARGGPPSSSSSRPSSRAGVGGGASVGSAT